MSRVSILSQQLAAAEQPVVTWEKHKPPGHSQVAVVTIHNPPVNALSQPVLSGVLKCVTEANNDGDVVAIVIQGSGGNFSAGADIQMFARAQRDGLELLELQKMVKAVQFAATEVIEQSKKPVVAAVDGQAFGGGCELAMLCHYRVCTAKTVFGLPELSLGVIPGMGGTQRLPRLIGLQQALPLMLSSKPLPAAKAFKLRPQKLVNAMVKDPSVLLTAAIERALMLASGERRRVVSLEQNCEGYAVGAMICDTAMKMSRKSAPHMVQAQACVEAVAFGLKYGPVAGLIKETELFHQLVAGPVAKGLVHVFFAQRAVKKVAGVTDVAELKPNKTKSIGVIGGGLMGSGIVTAALLAGQRVVLKEIDQKNLDAGVGRVKSNIMSMVKRKKLTEEKAEKTMANLIPTLDYTPFSDLDLVVEAVVEIMSLKQKIFADVAAHVPKHCLIATNTSTLDIPEMGSKLAPEVQARLIGLHFFSPAHVMPLLEIVKTGQTTPQVLLDALTWGRSLKKTNVVAMNCPGFAVNRVFFPYGQAAQFILDRGVDPYTIDKAVSQFGMPMGPFRLNDLVGGDVGYHVTKTFVGAYPERCYQSQINPLMFNDNRLGEKTGAGMYKHVLNKKGKRQAVPDPEGIAPYVAKSRQAANAGAIKVSTKDIQEMIFFPVINEACRILDENIVENAANLDIACVMGMGFPPFRGGICKLCDSMGAKYVCDRLSAWAAQFPQQAGFFAPCDYLKNVAAQGAVLCD